MNKKLLTIPALVLAAAVATVSLSTTASAESLNSALGINVHSDTSGIHMNADANGDMHSESGMMMGHGVFGTVTAINGNVITVTSKTMTKDSTTPTTTTYTVNTSSSTIVNKNRAASTLSSIAVGDTIMAEGTINGSVVTASSIHDGVLAKGTPVHPTTKGGDTNMLQGNGQPIIGGKVTAVSGNTITISNSSNAIYTIDVTNAKINKAGTATSASSIAVGDQVLAQGTINGNTVTAVSFTDGTNLSDKDSVKVGFFGKIGSFFSHLFGF
jgi:hypothetical protein